MEKGKRIKAVHGEIQLPEAIIQQILLFLNGKEAAQTSILSKSWYNAWATRPILDLDQRNYLNRGDADSEPLISDGFSESSKKIMRRYEESKLKIENFRLCMENTETESVSLAKELIASAVGLGAHDLSFEFMSQTAEFVLPHEVLGSGNLVRLSVSGCRIDLEATDGKVGFSMLKFLSLSRVCIVGFWDIISSCPLIEELVLSECTCSCSVRIYTGATVGITRTLALRSLTEFGNQNVGSILGDPISQYDNLIADGLIGQYNNLKCMFLEKIKIDKLLFHDMSRSFPCLKDLSLDECHGFIELQISSPSLEFLSIALVTMLTAKFDVPSLRKFTFSGTSLPFLSFEAASREWESDISLKYPQVYISYSWLVKLKDFLIKLSLSKISLSLRFGMFCFGMSFEDGFDDIVDGRGLPKPVVENFTDCSSLLKGVFWSCRPKFVTENWLPELSVGKEANSDMLKLICQTLIQEEIENCGIPSRYMHDLEEVNVEVYEDSIAEWQPLQWKVLLDASKSPEKKRKIRFKLRWGLDASTF